MVNSVKNIAVLSVHRSGHDSTVQLSHSVPAFVAEKKITDLKVSESTMKFYNSSNKKVS